MAKILGLLLNFFFFFKELNKRTGSYTQVPRDEMRQMRKMAEEKKLELEHRDHSQSVVDPKEHHLPMAADATGITTRV